MKIEAMPILMVGKYIPEICKSLESRQVFIANHLPKATSLKWPDAASFPGTTIYSCPDVGGRTYFFAVANNDLQYLMHLNPLTIHLLTHSPVYQGSVWRAEGSTPLIGRKLPSWIFWELHKTHDLFSDSLQSADGKRFWENRMDEAHERGLPVFAIHYHETNGIVVDDYQLLHRNTPIQHFWTNEAKQDLTGAYWRFLIKRN